MEKNGTLASPATALASNVLLGSRRAYQQCSLRNLASKCRIFLRILQEIHDFHYLILRAIQVGDILECHLDLILVGQFA